jgi:cellobiose-specific phosphotransferase system component IIC
MGNSAVMLIGAMVLIFLLIVGSFFLVFNFILRKTKYQLKVKSDNGEYSDITDNQKFKYTIVMVASGLSLGLILFIFVK